jgi:hypothetical protein
MTSSVGYDVDVDVFGRVARAERQRHCRSADDIYSGIHPPVVEHFREFFERGHDFRAVPSRTLVFYDGGYQGIPARVADKARWLLRQLKELLLVATPKSKR